jgi:uncharacterized protein with NRDE domain
MAAPEELPPGIHGVSNGAPGVQWMKVERGKAAMQQALAARDIVPELLAFLASRAGATIEESAFVSGDRYGTRSSSVIVVSGSGTLFAERNWLAGGVPAGESQLTQL